MFTSEEKEALIVSLQMRNCFLETGTIFLRSKDVANGHKGEIKSLSTGQMKLIILQDELIEKLVNMETL